MEYKVCSRCGLLNAFENDAEFCVTCMKELGLTSDVGDYSVAKRNRGYGSNTRKIYEGFCESLGWDSGKAGNFGRQGAALFAHNADTDRTRDVWFIFHVNKKFDAIDVDRKGESVNVIPGNGDLIYEIRYTEPGAVINDRITFVNVDGEYVFYGVYRLKEYDEEKKTRVFERYSDVYPVQE